jgi:hypothetical protein
MIRTRSASPRRSVGRVERPRRSDGYDRLAWRFHVDMRRQSAKDRAAAETSPPYPAAVRLSSSSEWWAAAYRQSGMIRAWTAVATT